MVLAVWRGQIEVASPSGDIRTLRTLEFLRFITKVELGYDRARIWYSFSLDSLTSEKFQGAAATGSLMTSYHPEGKRPRRRLKSEPKGPSERDLQIYELHKAGKTEREAGELFGISESKVRVIYWALRKRMKS